MQRTLLERLLEYYGITESEYQELICPVSEMNFAKGHSFEHISEASNMVKDVIKNNGRIFIYGDYDADGIMGASILVKMFMYKNYEADYYIPNRYQDGYGITLAKAQEIVEGGYSLVITVDNGISAFEPIKYLSDHHIKVLVLDHHTPQEELPQADYIIHPEASHFGEISSSGAFVAFMFSLEYLGYFDKYLSTLAAISVVSDMMPLKEYNRRFLRLVFKNFQEKEFPSIDYLKENEPFDETTIGLKISPKINAIGRMIDTNEINNLVEYFTTDDEDIILNYISWINETNENRKVISRDASNSVSNISLDSKCLVLLLDVKEGLLGLVANQLCSEHHVPAVVFTKEQNGEFLKGSCRAPEGFNVVDAFNQCSDILENSGGHALAGGCSLRQEDFERFKEKFSLICENTKIIPPEEKYIHLGINEINEDDYELVRSFAPFGEGWKAPKFFLRRIKTNALLFSKDNRHILTQISNSSRLVGFNFEKQNILEYQYVDMFGTLKSSCFKGRHNIEFFIKEIKES